MKTTENIKLTILICMMFCISTQAQYTKLFDFTNATSGSQPLGSVVISANDSILYGMTNTGGPNGTGTLFSINTNGTSYTNINTTSVNGYGSLIRSGNTLYGMTSGGGVDGGGTVFSVNTNGTSYIILHDFVMTFDSINPIDGRTPKGSLITSGGVLYGMTYDGGTNNKGIIFSINTNGTGYTKLLDFNGLNGSHPMGDLTLSGNVLYGMTLYGGANGLGKLFSINTNGTGYTSLLDFNTTNGEMPMGSLTILGNILYGVAEGGGLYNHGLIFSFRTDDNTFRDLFDFNGVSGENPMGSLIRSGSKLYGTTAAGGTNNKGTVFSVDTNGVGYQKLCDFDGVGGNQPRGTLLLSGNKLYGTTVAGGIYDDGVIFSLNSQPMVPPEICMVSADSSLNYNYNTVYWNNLNYTGIDSFIVYRYDAISTQYLKIGTVHSSKNSFTDTLFNIGGPNGGNPRYASWKYKLAMRDPSGNISQKGFYHQTMFVQESAGNFSWNSYNVEAGVNPVTAYSLLRDNDNTGNWQVLVNVAGTSTTDPNYTSYPNGNWRVNALGFDCAVNNQHAHSNTTKIVPASIAQVQNNQTILIWPNPASTALNIMLPQNNDNAKVSLVNALGKKIVIESELENSLLDISTIPSGVYFLRIQLKEELLNKKIIIQH